MDRKIGGLTFRELTGFLLLLILLGTGLLTSWYMTRQQGKIADALADGAWLALSGQWENARDTAESAEDAWQRHWKLWTALGDHTPVEDIDALFAELAVHAASGERTEFARTCSALSTLVEAVGNAHRLSWWNVL